MEPIELLKELAEKMIELKQRRWDYKKCILGMKKNGGIWKENEWPGRYFEYSFKKNAPYLGISVCPVQIENVIFDGNNDNCVLDLKVKGTNIENNHNGIPPPLISSIFLNDKKAMKKAIKKYKSIVYIILLGYFKSEDKKLLECHNWQEKLIIKEEGELSQYRQENKKDFEDGKKKPRLLKREFYPRGLLYLEIKNTKDLADFNQPHNSNHRSSKNEGKRNPKFQVKKEAIKKYVKAELSLESYQTEKIKIKKIKEPKIIKPETEIQQQLESVLN